AAIEFAVSELSVPEIVVMGHGLCGGIAAALSERPTGRFIGPWVELLAGIRAQLSDADPGARQKRLEQMAVEYSLQNLTSFPFVEAAIVAGRLRLHGAWFAIAEGELEWLDGTSRRFERVGS
ncbi:MAG TPA: carbonic anhydrase, partial [Hyphomicrobiaceae bacterium]|nr:carbonic anhydrase [Hyphomicrobiaceae bacterium]